MLGMVHLCRRSTAIAVALYLVTAVSLLAPAQDTAQDAEPYQVYVDQENVTARCGPGGDFYRTDPLRHGQALEVYVETADGWLGIRPPAGSFSWLPADVVKLSPSQDFGIITEDNTLTWIGTHLGKANKYLWQVQLAKGEDVAILGRATREGPDGPKLWLRIVPPAGEFRWVHRDQVVENPELLLRNKPSEKERIAQGEPTPAAEIEYGDDELEVAPRVAILPASEKIRREVRQEQSVLQAATSLPMPIPDYQLEAEPQAIGSGIVEEQNGMDLAADNEVARPYDAPLVAFTTRPTVRSIGQSSASVGSNVVAESVDVFSRRGSVRPAPAMSPSEQQQLAIDNSRVVVMPVSNVVPQAAATAAIELRSIDLLQLELSRLMSRSAPAGDVESIIAAAGMQARTAPSELDRQRAAMLTQRAQQYQQVARRRDGGSITAMPASAQYPAPVQGDGELPVPTSLPLPTSPDNTASNSAGYLVQVFSARPDSPPFALTDRQGRTTFYLSAAPGVNLRRYLNQYITVNGESGYATGLDTPHIIATGAVRSLEPK